MNKDELKQLWQKEEDIAHIKGWDFSHINDKYCEEDDLPWDYDQIVRSYLKDEMKLLDYDTGGGEYLLSLNHPYENTCATEGYPPNVELCKERLIPLGIDLRECNDCRNIPFEDETFDIMINRHGDFDPKEIKRILKKNRNDRDLVEMVLPDIKEPFPDLYLDLQKRNFLDQGFEIIQSDEAYRPIRFYDVGAFVWFARIIEWEFPGFSVKKCYDRLLKLQKQVEEEGYFEGTIHRYLIVARKA